MQLTHLDDTRDRCLPAFHAERYLNMPRTPTKTSSTSMKRPLLNRPGSTNSSPDLGREGRDLLFGPHPGRPRSSPAFMHLSDSSDANASGGTERRWLPSAMNDTNSCSKPDLMSRRKRPVFSHPNLAKVDLLPESSPRELKHKMMLPIPVHKRNCMFRTAPK